MQFKVRPMIECGSVCSCVCTNLKSCHTIFSRKERQIITAWSIAIHRCWDMQRHKYRIFNRRCGKFAAAQIILFKVYRPGRSWLNVRTLPCS